MFDVFLFDNFICRKEDRKMEMNSTGSYHPISEGKMSK